MSQALDRSRPPEPGAVRDFQFPLIGREQLDNGLSVFAIPHGQLPLVTWRIVVHAGGEHDDSAQSGLAYLTAHALEAGTRSRSADRLAWDFEKLGASLDIDVTWDYAALTATVPADRAEAALALLAEVVTAPAFLPDEIERLRQEQLAELLQREAEPRGLANDAITRFIFAPASPYQRPLPGQRKSVRGLQEAHVRGAFERLWQPGAAALLGAGEISEDRVRDLALRHLGEWSGQGVPDTNIDVSAARTRARIHIVHRAGAVQSEIRLGHLGVPRNHVDYYPLVIGNNILGGAFTSRLNMNLREKHGFTYGVRSGFAFRKHAGPFLIQTAVATDVTTRALEEIRRETELLLSAGPTAEEMTAARDYLSGTIPLELQTTEQIAARAGDLFVYDLPLDHYARHRTALRGVTIEETLAAIRRHIRLDDLIVTIVGDAEALERELTALGIGAIEVHEANDEKS